MNAPFVGTLDTSLPGIDEVLVQDDVITGADDEVQIAEGDVDGDEAFDGEVEVMGCSDDSE